MTAVLGDGFQSFVGDSRAASKRQGHQERGVFGEDLNAHVTDLSAAQQRGVSQQAKGGEHGAESWKGLCRCNAFKYTFLCILIVKKARFACESVV